MLNAQLPAPIYRVAGMTEGGSYVVELNISMPTWGDPDAENALISGIADLVAAVPGQGLIQVSTQKTSETFSEMVEQPIT